MNGKGPNYYIGDVHGRRDLLDSILKFVTVHARRRGVTPAIHFLGDIVDRGPDSKGAMDLVLKTLEENDKAVLHLGNHDQWFLEAVDTVGDFVDADSWAMHGGLKTLASYTRKEDPYKALAYVKGNFQHHMEMFRRARRFTEFGPFIACHAGVDPRRDFELMKKGEFSGADPFLWVRDPFLEHVNQSFRPVIHGHTIMMRGLPVVTENRISIDTGAYSSGRLTLCVLDPELGELKFYQTLPDGNVGEVDPILLDRSFGTVYDRLPYLFSQFRAAA
jgi:serine/threonine protein phosphatase 1